MAQCRSGMAGRTYMTVREFADHLGVSRPTVYRMLRDGTLVALRVGCQWRIDVERSVERLSAGHETIEKRVM